MSDLFIRLARVLDSLPNGFPSTASGSELRLLQKMFTPEEAELTLLLSPDWETSEAVALRTGREASDLRTQLKNLARRGLINIRRKEDGLNYSLLPFIVGIYENQVTSMDEELARLAEEYFVEAFGKALVVKPQFHRVIPVVESVRSGMEIHPYENAYALVRDAKSWGVLDCICRKQKALIGEGCEHPLDVCMAFSSAPDAFQNSPTIRTVTLEESLATLARAASAGLVHSVSNIQQGVYYICNCCTCSCGILRGIKETGMSNVVARSAYINTVDGVLCNLCGTCVEACQFDALAIEDVLHIDGLKCVGCGVCVPTCPSEALTLVRRPEEEIISIPETSEAWNHQRLSARGLV